MANAEKISMIQQVIEVTSHEAEVLLDVCNGDVDTSVTFYFEHGVPKDDDPRRGKSPSQQQHGDDDGSSLDHVDRGTLLIAPGLSGPGGDVPERKPELRSGKTAHLDVHLAFPRPGHKMPHNIEADIDWTVRELAEVISLETSERIPPIVMRIYFKAVQLPMGKKLCDCGIRDVKFNQDICVLYPQREEEGSIKFVNENKDKTLLTLSSGEWNARTSITNTRLALSRKMKIEPASRVELVFNGLTLKDATSFGQCGLFAGSEVAVFLDLEQRCKQRIADAPDHDPDGDDDAGFY